MTNTRQAIRVAGRLFATLAILTTTILPTSAQNPWDGLFKPSGGTPPARTSEHWIEKVADSFKLVDHLSVTKPPAFSGEGSGSLYALDPSGRKLGSCPLKNTSVSVHVSGYIASVDVVQKFHNSFTKKIEAEYTFPLSSSGAVDEMIMKIGSRTIHGTIKKREEARQIYEQARASGYVASLLDQERPNIFTQHVANIEPGKDVEVTIHYVDILPYEAGCYSFSFPTVVGPRFISGHLGGGTVGSVNNATQVAPVGSATVPAFNGTEKVNPAYAADSKHDLSITMDIDAGVGVNEIACPLHKIFLHPLSRSKAHLELVNQHERPNRDFVVSWKVASNEVKGGYFTEKTGNSGYLSMMLLPPARVTPETAAPKEMIFVVDRSGSQSGLPLEKAKETMLYILDHMNPNDTFQVISFSNGTEKLFDKPRTASAETKAKAKKYVKALEASGGTYMADAIKEVCASPAAENRLRIVTFMTDGYVDNDMEVLSLVKETRGKSRWFTFGTGDSVNRFLVDGVASMGGGEADYVLLNSPGEVVGKKFYDRISSPVLTDVKVSFEGVAVEDVFPRNPSDVWAEKPLYIQARYTKSGAGRVKLEGFAGGKPYQQIVEVTLPEKTNANNRLAQIWARAAVDELMAMDWLGMQSKNMKMSLKDLITELGLRYHIMTQFTSFVAVDDSFKTAGGAPISVEVPAEMPEGVSLDKVFGGMTTDIVEAATTGMYVPPAGSSVTIENDPSGINFEFLKILTSPFQGSGGFSGLVNWLVASSRDANLFSGGDCSVASPVAQVSYSTALQKNTGANPIPTPSPAPKAGWASAPISSPAPSVPQPILTGSGGGGSFGDAFSSQASSGSNTFYNTGSQTQQYSGGGGAGGASFADCFASAPAPVLQGAINGTLGPQGCDATVLQGINTSGTVRVNNLANLEALLNLTSNALDIGCLAVGVIAIIRGTYGASKRRAGSVKLIGFGFVWLAVWMYFCLALIPWSAFLAGRAIVRKFRKGDKAPDLTPHSVPEETVKSL